MEELFFRSNVRPSYQKAEEYRREGKYWQHRLLFYFASCTLKITFWKDIRDEEEVKELKRTGRFQLVGSVGANPIFDSIVRSFRVQPSTVFEPY